MVNKGDQYFSFYVTKATLCTEIKLQKVLRSQSITTSLVADGELTASKLQRRNRSCYFEFVYYLGEFFISRDQRSRTKPDVDIPKMLPETDAAEH